MTNKNTSGSATVSSGTASIVGDLIAGDKVGGEKIYGAATGVNLGTVVFGDRVATSFPYSTEVELRRMLEDVKVQVATMQQHSQGGNQEQFINMQRQLDNLATIIEKTNTRNSVPTAPVLLPDQEDMAVRLVPMNVMQQIEEYNFDRNIAFFLVGLFASGAFGILINWATGDQTSLTISSYLLMGLFIILTIGCALWVYLTYRREVAAKSRIPKLTVIQKPTVSESTFTSATKE